MAMVRKTPPVGKTQFERFVDAARQLGTDDDKDRFEEKLGKVGRLRPQKAISKKKKPENPAT
jgi:hypothetical protein